MDLGSPFFSEALFRELADHIPSFLWIREVDTGNVLYVNASWERMTGRHIRVGAHFAEFFEAVHPEDAEMAGQAMRRHPHGGFDEVLRLVHVDGFLRWVRVRTFPIRDADGRVYRVAGIGDDVTDVREVRELLEANEQKFRAIVEHSADLIASVGPDGALRYLSPRFESVLGFAVQDWIGRPMSDLVWSDDVERAAALLADCFSAPGRPVAWELRLRHRDGSWRWFEGTGINHVDAPAIGGVVVNCRDITGRRRREESLRNTERAIETALNSVAITDGVGLLTYVNPAFVRLWGYDSSSELIGKTPFDLCDPGETEAVLEAIAEHGAWQGEITAVRKDGTKFPVLASTSGVRDERGSLVSLMGSFIDLSEIRHLERKFLQAQKLESVGRLAGGVAHDFNNLLTVIMSSVSLARLDLRAKDPVRDHIERIAQAAQSAAGLTRQLLAFSRSQIIDPKVHDLNQIVERTKQMLVRLIGEDIELRTLLAPALNSVKVDASQVEQVLVNLSVNARDAMPDGGVLTIETANATLDQGYVLRHPSVTPGSYVMLAVSDSGAGIGEDVREHIFEPFFTTKGPSQGTGLGLAMVHGAVTQNGGHIDVFSEVGHGTTVKIYLPSVDARPEVPSSSGARGPAKGSEVVVLVEDDDTVRQLATRVLARLGYTVHSFSDGIEACEAIAHFDHSAHLLITDVVMPKMNGQVVAERMRAIQSDLKVLFTSGYMSNVIDGGGALNEGVEFLAKPYSVGDLARRVREVLDGRSA